jgi:hypothetical protein
MLAISYRFLLVFFWVAWFLVTSWLVLLLIEMRIICSRIYLPYLIYLTSSFQENEVSWAIYESLADI